MRRSGDYSNQAKTSAQRPWKGGLLLVLVLIEFSGCDRSGLHPTRTPGRQPSNDCRGVDTQTDSNNCGACGNLCSAVAPSTATCIQGRCLITLTTNLRMNLAFAVGTTDVYWSNSLEGIMKVPIAGGAPTTLSSKPFAVDIALDAARVYWISPWGEVMVVGIGGGTPTVLASEVYLATGGIAVDGTNVYWAISTTDDAPGEGDGAVQTVPIGGGTPAVFASGLTRPEGLTLRDRNIYWTNHAGSNEISIMAAPVGGGPVAILVSGPMSRHIAVDATNVYYCTNGDIMKVPVTGGDPTIVVPQGGCGPIAVDASSLYWAKDETDYSARIWDARAAIIRAPVEGGPVTVLAPVHGNVSRIAVDDTSVYWMSLSSVMKLTPK